MTREERERLAAEHVMGLLEGDEHQRAQALVGTDPAFAAMTRHWSERLSELDESAPALPPDDALWRRIEDGIAAQQPALQVDDPNPVIVPNPLGAFRSLWRSLHFWRIAGLTGAFASLALAIGLAVTATQRARQPVLVAVLMTDANQPAAVINAFANGRAELVPFKGVQIPHGHSFEIWTFPDPKGAPVSLGIVTQARTAPLDLGRITQPRPDQLFAVSVEPEAGSPTGLPTGPVMMKGTASTAL
jgi:anti-sigma-K factor RskA